MKPVSGFATEFPRNQEDMMQLIPLVSICLPFWQQCCQPSSGEKWKFEKQFWFCVNKAVEALRTTYCGSPCLPLSTSEILSALIYFIRWLLLYKEFLLSSLSTWVAVGGLDCRSSFSPAFFIKKAKRAQVGHPTRCAGGELWGRTSSIQPCCVFPIGHMGLPPLCWHRGWQLHEAPKPSSEPVTVLCRFFPRISSSRISISSRQHLSSRRRQRRRSRRRSSRTAARPTGRRRAPAREEAPRAGGSSTARTPASTRCLPTRNHA